MSFDSIIKNISNEADKNNAKADGALVSETFDAAQRMINVDYLDKIKNIPKIKKYIEGYKEMNLASRGWKIAFGTSLSWAGLCHSGRAKGEDVKNIYISIDFVKHEQNWKAKLHDTIAHEISHAINSEIFFFDKKNKGELDKIDDLDMASKGHGLVWKAICKKINGAECRIFYENSNFTDAIKSFKYVCTFCGHIEYGNFKNFATKCKQCDCSVITENNVG